MLDDPPDCGGFAIFARASSSIGDGTDGSKVLIRQPQPTRMTTFSPYFRGFAGKSTALAEG